jgi:hypothetical protein
MNGNRISVGRSEHTEVWGCLRILNVSDKAGEGTGERMTSSPADTYKLSVPSFASRSSCI